MKALGSRSIKCCEMVGFGERVAFEGELFSSLLRDLRQESEKTVSPHTRRKSGKQVSYVLKAVMKPAWTGATVKTSRTIMIPRKSCHLIRLGAVFSQYNPIPDTLSHLIQGG